MKTKAIKKSLLGLALPIYAVLIALDMPLDQATTAAKKLIDFLKS
jgi:hypothetical protein